MSAPLAVTAEVDAVRELAAELAAITTRPWTLMEVCGGQTHSIIRNGIDQLLDGAVEFIHGPGCPVCPSTNGADMVMERAVGSSSREPTVCRSAGAGPDSAGDCGAAAVICTGR